jgi:hypothetical protein
MPHLHGNHNIVITDVSNSHITANVDGQTLQIRKDIAELRQLLTAQQAQTFQAGGKIYNIGEITEANFGTILNEVKNAVINSPITAGGNVHVGDKYYTTTSNPTIPQELTIYLPKVEDLTKIIGRDKDINELRDLLVEKQKVVVVNGLGGIGKTTLAQAYLTQYADEYAHILWLTQSEGDNFVLDLITAQGLTHNLGITTEGKDTQTLFIEILSKIKSITVKPNLWVIDNANASLFRYFDNLPKPPDWHILATSREKIERFFVKDLRFFEPRRCRSAI